MAFPTVIVGGLIKDRVKTSMLLLEIEDTPIDSPVAVSVLSFLVNRFPVLATLITSLKLTDAGATVPSWLRKCTKALRGLLFAFEYSIDDQKDWIPTDTAGTTSNGSRVFTSFHTSCVVGLSDDMKNGCFLPGSPGCRPFSATYTTKTRSSLPEDDCDVEFGCKKDTRASKFKLPGLFLYTCPHGICLG